MSNLNYNNIDVQRILNVLNELYLKLNICSFLSFANLDVHFEEIRERITDENLMKDLEEHFEKIKVFREEHIEIKDEDDNTNKNPGEEEEELDDEGVAKEKEVTKKEKTDLKDITEETSEHTKKLANSIRNFCRKYYRNEEFHKLILENKVHKYGIDKLLFIKNDRYILSIGNNDDKLINIMDIHNNQNIFTSRFNRPILSVLKPKSTNLNL